MYTISLVQSSSGESGDPDVHKWLQSAHLEAAAMNSAAALSTAVDVCCCSLATRRPLIASKARFLMCPSSTTLVRNLIASVTTATDSSDSACTARDAAQQLGRNFVDSSHKVSGSAPDERYSSEVVLCGS